MIVMCGTNRPGANSRKVAKHVLQIAQNATTSSASFPIEWLDLGDFSQDLYEPQAYVSKPQWFTEKYQAMISRAKGILLVTPEYNGSFPGVLKYFIDMLKFPESLVGVPVAFIGVAAGQFGAMRSVEQLSHIFSYRSAHIFGERLFVPKINDVIQPDGSLGPYEERLVKVVHNFCRFVSSLAASGDHPD